MYIDGCFLQVLFLIVLCGNIYVPKFTYLKKSIVYQGSHKLCMNICLVVKVNIVNQDGCITFSNIQNSRSIYSIWAVTCRSAQRTTYETFVHFVAFLRVASLLFTGLDN